MTEIMDEMMMLSDVSKDVDSIIKMLGSDKMSESFDSGMLTGMLQNRGIDPGILALMKDGDGFGGNNGLIWLLFLLILGGGSFGFGNRGDVAKESTVLDQSNFNSLMTAISSQGARQESAIGDLATSLGCSCDSIRQALASVDKTLAVNQGSIEKSIADCCCRTNLNIERGNNAVIDAIQAQTLNLNNYMAAQNLDRERQTNQIVGAIANQTTLMQSGFCDIKEREYQHQIEDLKARLLEQSQAAQTAQIIAAVNAPKSVGGTLNTTAGTWVGTVPTS